MDSTISAVLNAPGSGVLEATFESDGESEMWAGTEDVALGLYTWAVRYHRRVLKHSGNSITVTLVNKNSEGLTVDCTVCLLTEKGHAMRVKRTNNIAIAAASSFATTFSDELYWQPISSQLKGPARISIAFHRVEGVHVNKESFAPPYIEGKYKSVEEVTPADVYIHCVPSTGEPSDGIPAHKYVLALHSPVFRAMFHASSNGASSRTVDISNFPEPVVRACLQYMYEDRCARSVLSECGQQLLHMADEYQVTGLTAVCERYLINNITVDNACELLQLAENCHAVQLRGAALLFLHAKVTAMAEKGALRDLSADLTMKVFKELSPVADQQMPTPHDCHDASTPASSSQEDNVSDPWEQRTAAHGNDHARCAAAVSATAESVETVPEGSARVPATQRGLQTAQESPLSDRWWSWPDGGGSKTRKFGSVVRGTTPAEGFPVEEPLVQTSDRCGTTAKARKVKPSTTAANHDESRARGKKRSQESDEG
jgi:hypothetical protein